MRRLAAFSLVLFAGPLVTSTAAADMAIAPDVAAPAPEPTPEPQVVVPPQPPVALSAPPPVPRADPERPGIEGPLRLGEEPPAPTAPRRAMSADLTFGPAFLISSNVPADVRLGETFRYHVGRTLEGFYVGISLAQVIDSTAVFLQAANRFGYDLWFPIDATLAFGVDFYACLGMFYYAPINATPGTTTSGFASMELENGVELKLYVGSAFYLIMRPIGLAYLSPGGLAGGPTFLDVSAGVGTAF